MGIVVVIMIVWTALAAGVANAQGAKHEPSAVSPVALSEPRQHRD